MKGVGPERRVAATYRDRNETRRAVGSMLARMENSVAIVVAYMTKMNTYKYLSLQKA